MHQFSPGHIEIILCRNLCVLAAGSATFQATYLHLTVRAIDLTLVWYCIMHVLVHAVTDSQLHIHRQLAVTSKVCKYCILEG